MNKPLVVKGACKANKIIWQEKLFNHQICEALFASWFIEDSSQQLTALFNPCQSSISFHIDTSHLICSANQMTSFYMNPALGRNGSNEVMRMKRAIVNPNPWFCLLRFCNYFLFAFKLSDYLCSRNTLWHKWIYLLTENNYFLLIVCLLSEITKATYLSSGSNT